MLYRRDICLLGGEINAINKKRLGLFSTIYSYLIGKKREKK